MNIKLTWTDTIIHNMSAEVEIPDEIMAGGNAAILEYAHSIQDTIQGKETEDDSQVIESFEGLEIDNQS
jgi:tRNA G37 N-methylase TrmD